MKLMKLSEIKISDSFKDTIPKEEKIAKCKEHWNTNHEQDRYIVINHDNVLIDGYIQYLVLKDANVDMVEVKISEKRRRYYHRKNIKEYNKKHVSYREQDTIYIFGIHPNSRSNKERVWRIPNFFGKYYFNNLHVGDYVLAKTKYGQAPVKITRIERLSKCPFEFPVKTIVKKIHMNNNVEEDI